MGEAKNGPDRRLGEEKAKYTDYILVVVTPRN